MLNVGYLLAPEVAIRENCSQHSYLKGELEGGLAQL